jgi:threonine/homoserine/homoserine lactone efflux protein
MQTVPPIVALILLAVLASALLPTLPVLAGGLLAVGAALGSWAGWRAGVARRPQVAELPVQAPSRHRRIG